MLMGTYFETSSSATKDTLLLLFGGPRKEGLLVSHNYYLHFTLFRPKSYAEVRLQLKRSRMDL